MDSTLNRVFFPLKSNAEWFQCDELRQSVEERLKHAMLIYDEILIEDGTYVAEVSDDGSFCPFYPAGTIPEEERVIEYDRDIAPRDLQYGIQIKGSDRIDTLFQGPSVARYKIDYYGLLKDIDQGDTVFVRTVSLDKGRYPDVAKRAIREQTLKDQSKLRGAHPVKTLRDLFIKNLNEDLTSSILLRSSIVLDHRHAEILRLKCSQISQPQFAARLEDVALDRLISLVVPDLSHHSMQEVVELRQDGCWPELRRMLRQLVSDIKQDPAMLFEQERVAALIESRISRALFHELESSIRTPRSLAIDIGMGLTSLIPGFGIPATTASTAKSIYDFYSERSSWYAFLLKLKK